MQTARSGEVGVAMVALVAVGLANRRAEDMAYKRVTSTMCARGMELPTERCTSEARSCGIERE